MMRFVMKMRREAQEVIGSFPSVIAIDGFCTRHNHPEHKVVVVRPGVSGYWAPPYASGKTLDEVDALHERVFHARKPTDAEREAAQIGSMAGWDVPGADPLNYDAA